MSESHQQITKADYERNIEQIKQRVDKALGERQIWVASPTPDFLPDKVDCMCLCDWMGENFIVNPECEIHKEFSEQFDTREEERGER